MMKYTKNKLTFESFVLVNYNDRELEVHCIAKGEYYYQPCVMYFKDGTGQPEDEDFTVENIEICRVFENGEEVTNYDTDELLELVDEQLYNEWENGSDLWEFPEGREPEEIEKE